LTDDPGGELSAKLEQVKQGWLWFRADGGYK